MRSVINYKLKYNNYFMYNNYIYIYLRYVVSEPIVLLLIRKLFVLYSSTDYTLKSLKLNHPRLMHVNDFDLLCIMSYQTKTDMR